MAAHQTAIATILAISVVMTVIACDRSPTAPSFLFARTPPTDTVPASPLPTYVNVSGTVWIHDADRVRPYAGANVASWVETARWGGGGGVVVTDSDGSYLLKVPVNSRLQIYVTTPLVYQPCAVILDVSGDLTRDLRAVSDRQQLGAGLPQELRSQSPTLSGVVFEDTPEGRRGLSDVRVGWDSTGGADLETATTLTDSEGRYVLCGLDRDRPSYVSVSKPGYPPSGKSVRLTAEATTLDIQLQGRR
jgi:hypothetical protein